MKERGRHLISGYERADEDGQGAGGIEFDGVDGAGGGDGVGSDDFSSLSGATETAPDAD